MEDLLPYFERELVTLRSLCRELHERYPGLGGRLGLNEDTCPDPHVEQMIQSVALLAARIAKRLDDSYPEFTVALLETLFPHALRPVPSCAIVRATHRSVGSAGAAAMHTIARGTEMDTALVQGVRCRFSTTYDIALTPLTVAAARFDAVTRQPAGLTQSPVTGSSLSIDIEGALPAGLQALRVFIDGEPSFCAALRDALFMRATAAWLEIKPGHWLPLPGVPLTPVGFADHEALLPPDTRAHASARLLIEYFAFPDKFNFFDIDLAALRQLLPAACPRFTLHLALAGSHPDSAAARLLSSLSERNLLLGCSPAVNLFHRPGQPISVTHTTADYGVLPDAAHASAYEVYSIDAVHMVRRRDQKETVTEFRPFYSLRHGEDASGKGHYWVARYDAALAATSPGHETRIALVDIDFNPMQVEKASLSIELSCTNRDLPSQLKYNQPDGDLTPLHDADGYTVRFLRRPKPPYRFANGAGLHWRLISHLSINHHALSQHGLPAFREMLTLYDLPLSPVTRRQIAGIVGLETAEAVTWLRDKYGTTLVHGTEVRMTLDEDAFVGTGLLLFTQVIDLFLGLYAQVNSFIELVVLSHQSGKELIRCQPRSGYQKLV